MAESWNSVEAFGEILLSAARPRQDPHRSGPLRRGSRSARRFPELPYVTLRLAYMACEYFDAEWGSRPSVPNIRRSTAACSSMKPSPSRALFPGLLKPVGLMAANFQTLRERVFERYPMMRSFCVRAADVVSARGAGRSGERYSRPWSPHRSFRTPDIAAADFAASIISCGFAGDLRLGDLLGADIRTPDQVFRRPQRLPSPSRHIYNPLTITVAFGRFSAFDRVWQHPIKVDGTFD